MQVLEAGVGSIRSLTFGPVGALMITGMGNQVTYCQNGQTIWQQEQGISAVLSAAFHPGGEIVAIGNADGEVLILNVESASLVERYPRQPGGIVGLAFSDAGKKLMIAQGLPPERGTVPGGLGLWPFPCAARKRINLIEFGPVFAFSKAPEGQHLAWLSHNMVQRTILRVGNLTKPDILNYVLKADSRTICISAKGTIAVSLGWDVFVYTTAQLSERFSIRAHKGTVDALAISPDDRFLLTGARDGLVKLWNLQDGTEKQSLQFSIGRITAAAISPDGSQYAVGSHDGFVLLWDAENV